MFELKRKHAIGITINGTEVRAAFLSLVRGKAVIKALESTKLSVPLDQMRKPEQHAPASINDLENAFDINESNFDPAEATPDDSEPQEQDQNVSQIYALLDKFKDTKANLAINAPILTVRYDYLEKDTLQSKKQRKKLKEKIEFWRNDDDEMRRSMYVDIADDKVLQVDYEYHPAIIDLMDEVNQFRAGNLNLILMDTNELALVDLVREIYKFEKNEITAIVYIEEDFSRVIFLKGRDIYHITPVVHKGSMSKDVLEVIYSRIIFAQDQQFIPEINKILVAGHSSRLKAKYFFRQKFPYAITGYLNSKKIQSELRFKDRGLLFSRYAVPIALAWKALQKGVYSSKHHNLLPEYIVERQSLPKLAAHGYLLLFLLALTAVSFSFLIAKKKTEIKQIHASIAAIKEQIDNNKSLTDRVSSFDSKIVDIEKKIALADSFSKGYDLPVEFLNLLNGSIRQIGDIWITNLKIQGTTVSLRGMSKRREKIPLLATKLGGANVKKITRSLYRETHVFSFNMDKDLSELKKSIQIEPFLRQTRPVEKMADSQVGQSRSANGSATPASRAIGDKRFAANGQVDGVYKLLVGKFHNRKQAERQADLFVAKGYEVEIAEARSPGMKKREFILYIGSYKTREAAQQLSDRLALKSGIHNKVVKVYN